MHPIRLAARGLIPAMATFAIASTAVAQQGPAQSGSAAAATASRAEIASFARAEAAIGKLRDSVFGLLAQPANKKDESQKHLREVLNARSAEEIGKAGLTKAAYDRIQLAVAIDTASHRIFDSALVAVTGLKTAFQQQTAQNARAVAANAPLVIPMALAMTPAGNHITHVVNSFTDTPNMAGLIATANREAGTASQHATLGSNRPTDLDYMKLHAGHVYHALDPQASGLTAPGAGYGVKKAALAAAEHIDLAAKAMGSTPNIVNHAVHIGTAARMAAKRADEAIELVKQIQAATSAADAAALMTKLIDVTGKITAGADANGDGVIGWQEGEGGLTQAQTHVELMVRAEGSGK